MTVSLPEEQKLFYFFIDGALNSLPNSLLLPERQGLFFVLTEVNWWAETIVGRFWFG